MDRKKIIYWFSILVSLTFVGCGTGVSTNTTIDDVNTSEDSNTSELTQELKDSITFMYSEEGLAYDVYMNIYQFQVNNNMPTANQLQQIASGDQSGSEKEHIAAVNDLAVKYDLNITKYPDTDHPYSTNDLERYGSGEFPVEPIQELYNTLYDKGIQSQQDALEVGCIVEIVDIHDLDEYIKQAEEANVSDVLDVFKFLRNGSYSHYRAFDEGLKKIGVTEGCCTLGNDYCYPEYL